MANLRVNGQERAYDGNPSMPLLWYLRDELSLTGTKFGCGAALCGACTVHIDGDAARSCVTPMASVAGKNVTTKVYQGAGHAFLADYRPSYREAPAYQLWGDILVYFDKHLRA